MTSAMTLVARTRTSVTSHSGGVCIKSASSVDRRDSWRTRNVNWRRSCSTWPLWGPGVSLTKRLKTMLVNVSKVSCDSFYDSCVSLKAYLCSEKCLWMYQKWTVILMQWTYECSMNWKCLKYFLWYVYWHFFSDCLTRIAKMLSRSVRAETRQSRKVSCQLVALSCCQSLHSCYNITS